jgi:hypothetical protein
VPLWQRTSRPRLKTRLHQPTYIARQNRECVEDAAARGRIRRFELRRRHRSLSAWMARDAIEDFLLQRLTVRRRVEHTGNITGSADATSRRMGSNEP